MTPPLSRDLRSPCGLPAARLSGKPKQKDSENGKALKNRGLRGSKRIYRNFVATTIRVHVGHIRKKIEPEPSKPRYLLTEAGVGYRFATPEAESASATSSAGGEA